MGEGESVSFLCSKILASKEESKGEKLVEDLQKSIEQNEEIEIDLGRLFRQLKKKMSFIIAVTVIAIIISLLVTKFLIPKKYESMARIYLKPNITESGMIDYNTLTANSKMVNHYVLMLQGNSLLEDVAEKLKLENEALVKNSLSVSNEADSEIITVSARTKDAKMSKDIVNTTVNLFFESMKDKLDIKNMTILDAPQVNETPVSPSLKMNLLIGALLGIMVSCGFVTVQFLLDKRLHTKEDAESYLEIPVLAEIPFLED